MFYVQSNNSLNREIYDNRRILRTAEAVAIIDFNIFDYNPKAIYEICPNWSYIVLFTLYGFK